SERKPIKINDEEVIRQQKYIDAIRKINDEHFDSTGVRKKHLTVTFGCQMNEHDSEKLDEMVLKMGYELTDDINEADSVIINTCAVRENAELKVFGNLGHLKAIKSTNKDMKISVCGCMMQQPHIVEEIKTKYRHVDLVFGTHNIFRYPQMLYKNIETKKSIIDVWDIDGEVVEGFEAKRKYELKAFVNVTFGCNNFCTYCIVPYTRGRERSRRPKDVIEEVKDLAKNGTKEVTLLGQNVNSYGNTFEEKFSFADLLRELNKIDGIERFRFMTSHPKDLSDELIEAIKDCNKVCPQIHLPFQAGSNKILKAMNRNYTKEHYLNLIEKIKTAVPDAAFTTDIMVGFPGETDEDFEHTMDVVKKVKYDSAFTFIYSVRKGTKAEKMDNHVPKEDTKRRFDRLLKEVNEISKEINLSYIGKEVEVLVEDLSRTNEKRVAGRTPQGKLVNLDGSKDLIGKVVKVKITEAKMHSLNGILA
ncbi:MAG: tRNA (N6-isopentenyl adenosine(37)-C2)-methylthiotransferase MiaB, partial [Peptostreptococcaceae bacterium]|nr:tRNA (N6-isopentenyl adenosine(37)-C2)-methylthiotransferase MiaB [Peptostreptococcaceae bacterium]